MPQTWRQGSSQLSASREMNGLRNDGGNVAVYACRKVKDQTLSHGKKSCLTKFIAPSPGPLAEHAGPLFRRKNRKEKAGLPRRHFFAVAKCRKYDAAALFRHELALSRHEVN
ncbi:MAG: hypothetical protein ACK5JM_00800 [Rhodoblastus sp.]